MNLIFKYPKAENLGVAIVWENSWLTLTNIPDTPHAYVSTSWYFHFLMVEPCFEVNFLAAKTFGSYFFLQFIPKLYTKWQQIC